MTAVSLVGCGEDTADDDVPSGPAVTSLGLQLLEERLIGFNPGCITCHSLDEVVTLVGPSLVGVGGRVAGRVASRSLPITYESR